MSAASSPARPRIFISHSHHDDALGLRLAADLRARLGEDAVWYDASGGLRGGDEWWKKIVAEITARDTFIVILSPDALASDWVPREMAIAYLQHVKQGKRLLPLAYRPCALTADWQLIQSLPISDPTINPAAYARQLAAIFNLFPDFEIPEAATPPFHPADAVRPIQAIRETPAAHTASDHPPIAHAAAPTAIPASQTPVLADSRRVVLSEPTQAPQQLSHLSPPGRTATVSAPPPTPARRRPTPPSRSQRLSPRRSPFIAITAVLLVLSLIGGLLLYLHVHGSTVSPQWSVFSSPTSDSISSVAMVSRSEGWAVGSDNTNTSGVILHYGGGQWGVANGPATGYLSSISMVSATDGWAVGGRGVILHYRGGQWQTVTSPTNANLNSISMVSTTEGWAVGDRGTMLHYTGGQWKTANTYATDNLFGVTMVSTTEGWAVGVGQTDSEDGLLLHYSGGKWTQADGLDTIYLHGYYLIGISMASATEGWAVGTQGKLLHYSGGKWQAVNSPTAGNLTSVAMVSATEGWAVGTGENFPYTGNVILHYSNGQWSVVNGPSSEAALYGVAMISPTEGWAVGDNGTILHYGASQ